MFLDAVYFKDHLHPGLLHLTDALRRLFKAFGVLFRNVPPPRHALFDLVALGGKLRNALL